MKFDWTPEHHATFLHLKEAIVQAPILHYPDPNKKYIVYTDASNDACGAQLSQEHNGTDFPVAFLSHTFMETQQKWSTTEQEAFGVYYAITKWNYYLQGADIIVRNDHEPLAYFKHTDQDGAHLSCNTLTGGHLSNFFIGFTIQIHLKWN